VLQPPGKRICINANITIIYLHIIMVGQAIAIHSDELSWYCVVDYVVNNMDNT
jgi:hypothetical protein